MRKHGKTSGDSGYDYALLSPAAIQEETYGEYDTLEQSTHQQPDEHYYQAEESQ